MRWLNRALNPLVKWVLRSPAHSLLSGSLLLLSYRGRRTGTWHTLPVQYARHRDLLYVVPGWPERKVWWRGLRQPSRVRLVLRGRPCEAVAVVVDDPVRLDEGLAVYLRRFPGAGRAGRPSVLVAVLPDPERERQADRSRDGR